MVDHGDWDLDRSTRRAWSRFRAELADHIVAMGDGDALVVDAESSLDEEATGAAPYVQFCAWGPGRVHAEVSSNAYLDTQVWLDDHAEAALLDLGWEAPTHAVGEPADSGSPNFYLDAERREGDRLATMAVAALRDVLGVPHPAFLSWPAAGRAAEAEVDAGRAGAAEGADEPLAVMPESPEHLRTLAAAALRTPDGPEVGFDEDGDIPLPRGSALVYVRVSDTVPMIEVFSYVVQGALDAERAAFEVAVLNRDTSLVKFVLLDDVLLATVHLPAFPFAPRQLRATVAAMAEVVNRVDDDLVARVGGRRALEPEPEADAEDPSDDPAQQLELHPALLTLLHLDPHGEGVDPELAASVCDHDRDLVLRFLCEAAEQEVTWRRSGDNAQDADEAEAEACLHEGRAWRATVETLRAALRVIVEQQHGGRQGRPQRRNGLAADA